MSNTILFGTSALGGRPFSADEIADFRAAFNLYDKDGDGKITAKELEEAMRSLGVELTKEGIRDMINGVDIDLNGMIGFDEFIAMKMRNKKSTDTQRLQEAFQRFDKDGDGYITQGELKLAMTELGNQLTEEELRAMIEYADVDGDGKVDFTEFLRM